MCSLFDKSFRTIAYVITLHQVHLSQMTKHWDGFVSHCRSDYRGAPAVVWWFGLHLCGGTYRGKVADVLGLLGMVGMAGVMGRAGMMGGVGVGLQ